MHIDLSYRLSGNQPIQSDHGYALFASVSRLLPEVHAENGIAIHPIAGRQEGDRRMMLMPWSTLSFRVAAEKIPVLLSLAGRSLVLHDATVRLGVPEVRTLAPATALRSRLVVIKVAHTDAAALTAETFAAAARKQMEQLAISPEAMLSVGKRRTMRMKQSEVVGYEVIVEGLMAEESIALQENGIGGKRHMGCGVFLPLG